MICAYEATGEQKYLNRAILIAGLMPVELAKQCNCMIWEHYDRENRRPVLWLSPSGEIFSNGKYRCVQAETIAAIPC
jgi:mannose/cellobiose epimerase-like protein (N-acyl-D-glucosamine 2-epimerase family)